MHHSDSTPGITALMAGILTVSAVMTEVTGDYFHWPFVLAGIAVGLLAVRSINR